MGWPEENRDDRGRTPPGSVGRDGNRDEEPGADPREARTEEENTGADAGSRRESGGPARRAPRRRRGSRSGKSGVRGTGVPARAERRGSGTNSSESADPSKDPVQAAFDGRVDLYEIARWEVRTPLDRFAVRLTNALEESRRWLLLTLAIGLFAGQFVIAAALIAEEPLLGILGLASIVPALVLAGYFWYRDPTRQEPLVPLAVTFLLSVGFASVAGVFNSVLIPFFELFGTLGLAAAYFVVVGPVEETVKWLAVRVYAYRGDAFRTVVDGVVYGAMAGVGFAAIENLLYIIMVSVDSTAAGIAVRETEAVAIATQRAFVGPGHVIFSAWAGFYLGLAKFNQGKRGPIVVKGLVTAAFIHALYNTLVTTLPLTVGSFLAFVVVFDGFWFALLYRKIRAYRRLYRQRP
jgi:RsiW-degrading membrane proteinase PrsW (M82 family)